MLTKVKVKQADGTIGELELAEPAEVEAEVERRMAELGKAQGLVKLEHVLKDERFRKSALEIWGIKPGAPAPPDPEAINEAVAAAKTEWEKEALEPVKRKLGEEQGRAARLHQRDLDAQILAHASRVGVRKSLMVAPAEGERPLIATLLAGCFACPEGSEAWALKQGAGFAPAAKPTTEQPYKGVGEFMDQWAADPANKDFLGDERQRGPGLQIADTSGSKDVLVTRAEIQDHQRFKAAAEQAKRQGGTLRIRD